MKNNLSQIAETTWPIDPQTELGPSERPTRRKMPWRTRFRKWNNVLHRDLGYFFSGTVILYALSGLAVNHLHDWDPNFIIKRQTINVDVPTERTGVNDQTVSNLLTPLGESSNYRSHDFPSSRKLKIYLDDGSLLVDLQSGTAVYETVKRRPFFYQSNTLHLNPKRWWLVFSDVFAVGLVLITVTGLFVLKGKRGITGRGAILAGAGTVIPLIFLFTV